MVEYAAGSANGYELSPKVTRIKLNMASYEDAMLKRHATTGEWVFDMVQEHCRYDNVEPQQGLTSVGGLSTGLAAPCFCLTPPQPIYQRPAL
jgi:hypothetical protein